MDPENIVVEGKYSPDYGWSPFDRGYFLDIFGERGKNETIFGQANFYGTNRPYTEREKVGELGQQSGLVKAWEAFKKWVMSVWDGLKNAKWGFGMTGTEWMITAGGLTYTHKKSTKSTNPKSIPSAMPNASTFVMIGIAVLVVFFLVR